MVMGEFTQETEVLVIGGGPGGYAAAFRAADLGLDVTLVDAEGRLGGVCLYRGCIPSKTLLYVTEMMHDARRSADMGLTFGEPKVDLEKMRQWKNQVIGKLAGGLAELCKQRGIQLITGRAVFEESDQVRVLGGEVPHIKYRHAILASGSHAASLPGIDHRQGGRVMGSSGALGLPDIPERLLIVGGGYVGVELGSVYASLGSRVTIVEWLNRLMAGTDMDLLHVLQRKLEKLFEAIHYKTKVTALEERGDKVHVTLEGEAGSSEQAFDRVLVAVGRHPSSRDLGIEKTKIKLDERGYVLVDEQMRTADPKIFAVGDVVGGVMLAHKAMYEGKVAAEVIAGHASAFDFRAIPAVVYTDPQIAWCGLTEEQAHKEKRPIRVSRFPWSASGRAASMGVFKGMSKLIIDPKTNRVLGMGIVGREAGEMIAEGVLAVEMGALAEDIALSIHPHPTLSEGEGEAAEAFLGSSTHILPLRNQLL